MTPRLVSLAPAATEWLVAFGAAQSICGTAVPHEAVVAPLVARPGFADDWNPSALSPRGPVERDPEVDLLTGTLGRVSPEMVIYDGLDEQWPADFDLRLRRLIGRPVELFCWAPRSLREIFEHVLRLARTIDRLVGAMKTLGDGEMRLRESHARTGINRRAAPETLPGVVVVTENEPLVVAGRWMSELVDRAAGHALLTSSGAPARIVTRSEVEASDPKWIVSAGASTGDFEGFRRVTFPDPHRLGRSGPDIYDVIVELTEQLYPFDAP